jgi:hypothetical protein
MDSKWKEGELFGGWGGGGGGGACGYCLVLSFIVVNEAMWFIMSIVVVDSGWSLQQPAVLWGGAGDAEAAGVS